MKENISKLIQDINQSIGWVKKYRPADYEQRFLQLVEQRRKLRVMANAMRYNPGIAAYGQSQVGKSYLMNCILKDGNSPFMVDSPEGPVNFVDSINPIGGGNEATGVVTRFSSYVLNEEEYSKQYPIRMRVLGVKDILLIISTAYLNNYKDYTTAGQKDVDKHIEEVTSKYGGQQPLDNPHLTSDDLLDIKEYFIEHINNGQVYSKQTPFFEKLALFIESVKPEDYTDIFSILWNKEADFTTFFEKSLDILNRLEYNEFVYLPIGAVKHNGIKENTIMSVLCLNMLFSEDSKKYTTEAYSKIKAEGFKSLGTFTKSELSTVCSEVIIKIKEEILDSVGEYDLRDIPDRSKDLIPSTSVSKDILRKCDLLDFPGALPAENAQMGLQRGGMERLMYNVRRGKVAYLFNKFSEEKIINILLYCHFDRDNYVTDMQDTLRSWVEAYVGKTPEDRAATISKTKISPLFHIGTMWNNNLKNPDNKTEGFKEEALRTRWTTRFVHTLGENCFHVENDWVLDWVPSNKMYDEIFWKKDAKNQNVYQKGEVFHNCYMLRDFNYSEGIYSGFEKTGKEEGWVISKQYYDDMRRTFIESNNKEHHFFANPELAWDLSATRGNDGSLYIIQNLSVVASNIAEARKEQWNNSVRSIAAECNRILRDYHISTDVDKILDANIRRARSIMRELDFASNDDNYYFGHLIEALQVREASCYREVHAQIQGLSFNSQPDNWHDYEVILMSCRNAGHPIDKTKDTDEKWEALIATYAFMDKQDAEDYLQRHHVDVDKLFGGEQAVKRYSNIIATAIYDKWIGHIKSVEFIGSITANGNFDSSVMSSLTDCIKDSAEALGLCDAMSKAIAEFTDTLLTIHGVNESLIADILASKINDFVLDFGYSYLSTEDIEKARHICENRNLPAFEYIERQEAPVCDDEILSGLFLKMTTEPTALQPSFENNYNKWREYMFIAFVAHLEVPAGFDKAANDKIAEILEEINSCSSKAA